MVLVIVENLLFVEISRAKIHCSAVGPLANIFRLGAQYCIHTMPSCDGSNPYSAQVQSKAEFGLHSTVCPPSSGRPVVCLEEQ